MKFRPCIKKGFEYEKDAEAYLHKLKRIYKNEEKHAVRSYLCNDCGLWHLTSRLHPLEDEIIKLHDEIEKLKADNKQLRKAENTEIDKDKRVEQLAAENVKLKKEIAEIRKTISDLITKNVALQRELNSFVKRSFK